LGGAPRSSAARIAAGLVIAVSAGGAAQAQSGQNPPAPTGLGRADVDPARRTAPTDAVAEAAAPVNDLRVCPFAGQGVNVTLTRVMAEGATQVSPAEIDAEVAQFLNRETDLAVICQIRDRVAELYMREGRRLTRVELPEQRITDGVLRLRVTEGYVASTPIERPEAQGPSAALAQAYMGRLQTGRPAEWSEVERAVLLVREIPGAEPDIRLRPSMAGPGAIDVVTGFSPRRRFDVTVGAQYLGSEELGETAVFARVDANSFTRFGERTSLILFSSTGGEQQVVQLLEEVRLGWGGLLARADVAYGRTEPAGVLTPLEIEGEALIARFGLRYPVILRQTSALTLGVRFDAINQENALGVLQGTGDATLFKEQLRVLAGELDFRWRPAGRLSRLTTAGNLEIRKGVEGLGSSETGDAQLSRVEGRPDFASVRLSLRARYDFQAGGQGPWAEVRTVSQWADGPLLAYEEYQVGNYTVGRGYDPGAASGDDAVAAQFEAGWTFVSNPGGARLALTPFAFYDMARLTNEDKFGFESEISSYGAGLHARYGNKYDVRVTYAVPQDEPIPNAPKPDARWLITFARAFAFH
jgi:hemolysin activation/secretion protein